MRHSTGAIVAGITGFAVMGLELTAVRLMAPHFGDSAYVWTNVIGVILLALALGAFLGGRMADRRLGGDRLFWLLVSAGVLTALVPLLARPVGAWLVPADLPLDSAMGALVRGSLVATALLFAPPVLLVACVAPMLVALLAGQDGRVGRASGLISSSATVGSLIGTFAATHLLIPNIGSSWTVWICALWLLVAALICRPRRIGAAALLLPFGLSFLAPAHLKAPGPGELIRAEIESRYQFLQVVELKGSEPRRTSLKINEGLDSFHSVAFAGTPYTDRSYYDYHVIAPFLANDGAWPDRPAVLSLGEAAGTFGRLFAHVHPTCTMDAVEIDPAVMRLGAEFFHGARPPGESFAVDARVFVENTTKRYDSVLVDTYKHQIYIPAHIASEQFFAAVHRVLNDGGVVSVNSGGTRFDDPVIRVLASTMARVFGEAKAFRVPLSRNFVLMARKGKGLDPAGLAGVPTADPELQQILRDAAQAKAWRSFGVVTEVLQDDRPSLDRLQEEFYSRGEQGSRLVDMSGTRPAGVVEGVVLRLRLEGALEEALAAIGTAEEPTAALRTYAGDCRWLLRDAQGALLEYEEAKRLGTRSDVLDQNIHDTREEVEGRLRAWGVGRRNGWLAFLTVAGLFGLAVVLYLPRG